MRGIRDLLSSFSLLLIAAVLAGFLGRLHPFFDSVSVFRLHLALALAGLFVCAVVLRAGTARFRALVGLFIAIVGLVPTLIPAASISQAKLTGYSQNLLYKNQTPQAVIDAILEQDVDYVLLQEVSEDTKVIATALAQKYPTQVMCDFSGVGGVAILTRLPAFGAPGCARGQGIAWLEVQTDDGIITLASIHLPWPWPHKQARQVEVISELLAKLSGRIILAGDFNMVPWAHNVARIAEASRTAPVSGLRLTFHRSPFWPGLPIDHVLVHESLTATVTKLEKYGSDHTALKTEIYWDSASN